MRTRIAPRRGGFTLVELLVAIGLALVLLGLAIAVSQSTLFDSYKVVGAGDRVTQWLVTAKGKASRDRAPRGLRFLVNPPATPGDLRQFSTECVYIEQPEPWRPKPSTAPGNATALVIDYLWNPGTLPQDSKYGHKRVWVSNGTLGDFDYYPQNTRPASLTVPKVRIGDTVDIPNVGMFRIAQITVVGSGTRPDYPPTAAPLPSAVLPTTPAEDPSNPNVVTGSDSLAAFQLFLVDPVMFPGTDGTPGGIPTQPSGYMFDQVNALPDLGAMHGQTNAGIRTAGYRAGGSASATLPSVPFSITRQAQPLAGEATLQLAKGMVVDFTQFRSVAPPPAVPVATSLNVAPANGYVDILFAPSGEVIQNGGTAGLMVLLVRDTGKFPELLDLRTPAEAAAAGEMVLVCVYTRTGAVATQPPATPPTTDPYQFAKDGINTGL